MENAVVASHKDCARRLNTFIKAVCPGADFTYNHALNAIAVAEGFSNWNQLRAQAQHSCSLLAEPPNPQALAHLVRHLDTRHQIMFADHEPLIAGLRQPHVSRHATSDDDHAQQDASSCPWYTLEEADSPRCTAYHPLRRSLLTQHEHWNQACAMHMAAIQAAPPGDRSEEVVSIVPHLVALIHQRAVPVPTRWSQSRLVEVVGSITSSEIADRDFGQSKRILDVSALSLDMLLATPPTWDSLSRLTEPVYLHLGDEAELLSPFDGQWVDGAYISPPDWKAGGINWSIILVLTLPSLDKTLKKQLMARLDLDRHHFNGFDHKRGKPVEKLAEMIREDAPEWAPMAMDCSEAILYGLNWALDHSATYEEFVPRPDEEAITRLYSGTAEGAQLVKRQLFEGNFIRVDHFMAHGHQANDSGAGADIVEMARKIVADEQIKSDHHPLTLSFSMLLQIGRTDRDLAGGIWDCYHRALNANLPCGSSVDPFSDVLSDFCRNGRLSLANARQMLKDVDENATGTLMTAAGLDGLAADIVTDIVRIGGRLPGIWRYLKNVHLSGIPDKGTTPWDKNKSYLPVSTATDAMEDSPYFALSVSAASAFPPGLVNVSVQDDPVGKMVVLRLSGYTAWLESPIVVEIGHGSFKARPQGAVLETPVTELLQLSRYAYAISMPGRKVDGALAHMTQEGDGEVCIGLQLFYEHTPQCPVELRMGSGTVGQALKKTREDLKNIPHYARCAETVILVLAHLLANGHRAAKQVSETYQPRLSIETVKIKESAS